jgi:hypothetical protein
MHPTCVVLKAFARLNANAASAVSTVASAAAEPRLPSCSSCTPWRECVAVASAAMPHPASKTPPVACSISTCGDDRETPTYSHTSVAPYALPLLQAVTAATTNNHKPSGKPLYRESAPCLWCAAHSYRHVHSQKRSFHSKQGPTKPACSEPQGFGPPPGVAGLVPHKHRRWHGADVSVACEGHCSPSRVQWV